jgi:hypothetical protein
LAFGKIIARTFRHPGRSKRATIKFCSSRTRVASPNWRVGEPDCAIGRSLADTTNYEIGPAPAHWARVRADVIGWNGGAEFAMFLLVGQ